MEVSIALQLYSVRDAMTDDFGGTLRRVREFGYDGVEFAGLFGNSPQEVRRICTDLELEPVSAHVPYGELLSGEAVFESYAAIGCTYIAIPWVDPECFAGGARSDAFYDNVRRLGEIARRYQLKLCYHNHNFELEQVAGEYKIDRLYKAVSPELLSTELDTGWIKMVGADPADFIRKYAGRAEIVHLKDFVDRQDLPASGEGDGKTAAERFELGPLGCGAQDLPAILQACSAVRTKWIVIEQERPSMGKNSLECADMSIRYLHSQSL